MYKAYKFTTYFFILKINGSLTGKLIKLCWWSDDKKIFGGESMLYLFSLWSLEKLDLENLDFWLFTEMSILDWFLTWFFKYALITVRTYFQTPINLGSSLWPPVLVLNFQPAGGRLVKLSRPVFWYSLTWITTTKFVFLPLLRASPPISSPIIVYLCSPSSTKYIIRLSRPG